MGATWARHVMCESAFNVTDSRTFVDEPNISGLSGPLVLFFFFACLEGLRVPYPKLTDPCQ